MAANLSIVSGAHPDPPDARDYALSFNAATPSTVDWDTGTGFPLPPLVDQEQTDACVAFACSYYHWAVRSKDFSRRDLFTRIVLPAGGALIRDGMMAIVTSGQALQADVPDALPTTQASITDKTGIVPAVELPWKELNCVSLPLDIDSIARAIQMFNGIVMGLYYTMAGWGPDPSAPEPPLAVQLNPLDTGAVGKHALYFFDFHIHDDGNGQKEKCLIAASSWPTTAGVQTHHIRKSYLDAKAVYCPWVFAPASFVQAITQNVTLTVPDSGGPAPKLTATPAKKEAKTKKVKKKSAIKKLAAKSTRKDISPRSQAKTSKKAKRQSA